MITFSVQSQKEVANRPKIPNILSTKYYIAIEQLTKVLHGLLAWQLSGECNPCCNPNAHAKTSNNSSVMLLWKLDFMPIRSYADLIMRFSTQLYMTI